MSASAAANAPDLVVRGVHGQARLQRGSDHADARAGGHDEVAVAVDRRARRPAGTVVEPLEWSGALDAEAACVDRGHDAGARCCDVEVTPVRRNRGRGGAVGHETAREVDALGPLVLQIERMDECFRRCAAVTRAHVVRVQPSSVGRQRLGDGVPLHDLLGSAVAGAQIADLVLGEVEESDLVVVRRQLRRVLEHDEALAVGRERLGLVVPVEDRRSVRVAVERDEHEVSARPPDRRIRPSGRPGREQQDAVAVARHRPHRPPSYNRLPRQRLPGARGP